MKLVLEPRRRLPHHTAVATTVVRSRARPARRMGDDIPAGLLARGSGVRLRLPGCPARSLSRRAVSGSMERTRRLQLRGQPRLAGSNSRRAWHPCSLLPPGRTRGPDGTDMHRLSTKAGAPSQRRCGRPTDRCGALASVPGRAGRGWPPETVRADGRRVSQSHCEIPSPDAIVGLMESSPFRPLPRERSLEWACGTRVQPAEMDQINSLDTTTTDRTFPFAQPRERDRQTFFIWAA